MRKKISANIFLNSLGITRKKSFYILQSTKNIKYLVTKQKNLNTLKSLIKLNEIITEKKVSTLRIKDVKNIKNQKIKSQKKCY